MSPAALAVGLSQQPLAHQGLQPADLAPHPDPQGAAAEGAGARQVQGQRTVAGGHRRQVIERIGDGTLGKRSEEHTSELQSRGHLVCRLLLEKKKKKGATRLRSTVGDTY